jgi:hypothetical protein
MNTKRTLSALLLGVLAGFVIATFFQSSEEGAVAAAGISGTGLSYEEAVARALANEPQGTRFRVMQVEGVAQASPEGREIVYTVTVKVQ